MIFKKYNGVITALSAVDENRNTLCAYNVVCYVWFYLYCRCLIANVYLLFQDNPKLGHQHVHTMEAKLPVDKNIHDQIWGL